MLDYLMLDYQMLKQYLEEIKLCSVSEIGYHIAFPFQIFVSG